MTWSVFLLPLVLAASEAPILRGPAAVADGETPLRFTIEPPVGGTVFVDGCAPIELEREEAGKWVPVTSPVCDAPPAATAVERGRELTVPRPAAGTWRANAAFGIGCVPGRPFIMAACKTLGSVRSETFTIP